jgi:hypothetical protein
MYPDRRVDPDGSCRYAQQQRRESDMGEPAVRTRKGTRLEYDRLAAAAPFGWRHGRAVTLGPAERVSPLAAPAAAVAVADLLP